jgi:hypothetical protein
MPKTKAEVAKMVRVNKTKQYSKLSTEQQQAKYKSIMESPRKDTAVAKIELSVLRKLVLASKKSAKKTAVVPKPAPKKPAPAPKTGRTYQYTVYLPEDYSDVDALKYWKDSKLVTMTSGVDIGKELTAEGGRPIFDKGTYHVFKAKQLHPIKEWKEATKGRPTGFVSDTGKNYGYTGGIVKKVSK